MGCAFQLECEHRPVGLKAMPGTLWLHREIRRTCRQGMNFVNKAQREGAGGIETGPLPPGRSNANNQLPGHQGCCTGKGVGEGKRSLL